MKRIISLAVSLALIFVLVSCSGGENEIIKYDIAADPVNLDPQLAGDYSSLLVLQNSMEGLLRINSEGRLTEGVAKTYSVSDDKLIYKFNLRSDAKWEDGAQVTAYDFEFAFKRLFMPETGSPSAENYYCIKNASKIHKGKSDISNLGVRAEDNLTLYIVLERPDSMFLQKLTSAAAMPCNEKFFTETKGKYGLEADKTYSNGAFLINSWAHDDYIALRRNPNYVSSRKVIPAGVSFIVEQENAAQRFVNKQTDAYIFNGYDNKNYNYENYNLNEYSNTTWGIGFNLKNKYFKQENIRKALVECFDITSYSNALPDFFVTSRAIVPPSITMLDKNYREFAGESVMPDYDSKSAKTRLEQAGIKKNELNKLTIIAPDNLPHIEIFDYASQIWQKELNVYIKTEKLPIEDYEERIQSGEYDCAVVALNAEYNSPESVLSNFSKDGNIFSYDSDYLRSLLEKASEAADLAESAAYYKTAESLLVKDGIFIPMYSQIEYFATRSDISGIHYYPSVKLIDFAETVKK